MWNINGNGDKLGDPDIHALIKEHDIVTFTETMKDKHYEVDIPGYCTFHFARKTRHKNAKRASGGFLVLIHNTLVKHVSIEHTNQYVVWATVKSYPAVTHIGFVYIPPIGAVATGESCPFSELQNEILTRCSTGRVVLCGDFNSRTAEIRDMNLDGKFTISPLFSKNRSHRDQTVNTYVRKLIDLCRDNDMLILNGRTGLDETHKNDGFTCIRDNGSSVVDYVISHVEAIASLSNFKVVEKLMKSDHTPLSFKMEVLFGKRPTIRGKANDIFSCYKWNCERRALYLEACNAAPARRIHQDNLCEITNQNATSYTIVGLFQNFIMSGIGNNFKKTNKNINKDVPYNQWFDQECKALKSLLKDKHIGNERRCHLQRVYRGTVQRKKRQYYQLIAQRLVDMHCYNPTAYWRYWKKLRKGVGNTYHIELKSFSDYYKTNSTPAKNDYFDYDFMDKIATLVDK